MADQPHPPTTPETHRLTRKERHRNVLSDYDGQKAAVARIQRRLDGQLDTIRNTRAYSDTGRKTEMAKAVLAARAQVEKLKSEFVAERETAAIISNESRSEQANQLHPN